MSVLITCRGVLDVHMPPDTVYAEISSITGVRSVSRVNLIATIPKFVGGGKTVMVRQLNNFC